MNVQRMKEWSLVAGCIVLDMVLVVLADGRSLNLDDIVEPLTYHGLLQFVSGALLMYFVVGQLLALGIILAMRRGTLIPIGMMVVAALIGGPMIEGFFRSGDFISMAFILLEFSLATYFSFRVLCWLSPNRLPRENDSTLRANQFTIARVMIGTAIVAFALAFFRSNSLPEWVVVSWIFVGVFLLPVVIGGVALFDRGQTLRRKRTIFWGMAMVLFLCTYPFVEGKSLLGIIAAAWLFMMAVKMLEDKPTSPEATTA